MKNLANVFSLSSKNDAPPETNAVDVPLTSPPSDAQVAAVDDNQDKSAGIKKSSQFGFFGKKDKVTKAELLENFCDLQKQQEAVEIDHKKEMQALELLISEIKNQQQADNHARAKKEQAFQSQFDQMVKKYEADLAARDKMLQTFEATIIDLKLSIDDMNTIVIKRLVCNGSNSWNGYSTLDENDTAVQLSLDSSKRLAINGVASFPSKKLVLTGVVSDYNKSPFEGGYNSSIISEKNISRLLAKVDSCKLTDVFLDSQLLSWLEYEKLVAGGAIKNVYFYFAKIKDDSDAYVPLEKILQSLPNIEKVYWRDHGGSYKKETFKNLVELPSFNNLQEFKLSNIPHKDFDMDSFLDFMKKHPMADFTLKFASFLGFGNTEIQAMKEKMYQLCPTPAKLKIVN